MAAKVIIIAALSQNGVIGADNDLPWRIGGDFRRFKSLTMGYPCIMGRRTFESLPKKAKPLPGRENIVLTSNRNFKPDNTTVLHSFEHALDYATGKKAERVFITGGAAVYEAALPYADVLELTKVCKTVDGNVRFPQIDWSRWELVRQQNRKEADQRSGESVSYIFLTYCRK